MGKVAESITACPICHNDGVLNFMEYDSKDFRVCRVHGKISKEWFTAIFTKEWFGKMFNENIRPVLKQSNSQASHS